VTSAIEFGAIRFEKAGTLQLYVIKQGRQPKLKLSSRIPVTGLIHEDGCPDMNSTIVL